MKRPVSPCVAARRRKQLRRLHAVAAPQRRKRKQDCGLYRTLGPPPEKRPRLEGVDSHAFLWEIQETPKEPTFGCQAQAAQEWQWRGPDRRDGAGAAVLAHGLWRPAGPGQAGAVRGAGRAPAARRRRHGAVQPARFGRGQPGLQRLQLLEDSLPGRQRRRRHGVASALLVCRPLLSSALGYSFPCRLLRAFAPPNRPLSQKLPRNANIASEKKTELQRCQAFDGNAVFSKLSLKVERKQTATFVAGSC